MNVFLFDIDGTLLLTGGAGQLAMRSTMNEMFGLQDLATIAVSGRTDFAIISDLFEAHQLKLTPQIYDDFRHSYHEHLTRVIRTCEGQLMPGVRELLGDLQLSENVELGILTGNSQTAADIKLEHFELEVYFEFGGFGDRHADRNDVARSALESCKEFLSVDQVDGTIWVVGDTVHDIRCAKSIGAKSIAVETGFTDPEQLSQESPDLQLPNLTHQRSLFELLA